MDTNIYVVYDSKKETEESLQKFIEVMHKADFPENKIVTLSDTEFDQFIERKELLPFVLCLNSTFKTYCVKYSDILNIPVFEFFSKEYFNVDKSIFVSGILLNIDSIFQPSYKKYAWSVLQKFYTQYSEVIQSLPTSEEILIDLEDVVETIEEDVVEVAESLASETVVDEAKEINFDTAELKEFYFQVKDLINQFNIVQEKIKIFDKHIGHEKL